MTFPYIFCNVIRYERENFFLVVEIFILLSKFQKVIGPFSTLSRSCVTRKALWFFGNWRLCPKGPCLLCTFDLWICQGDPQKNGFVIKSMHHRVRTLSLSKGSLLLPFNNIFIHATLLDRLSHMWHFWRGPQRSITKNEFKYTLFPWQL